MRLLLTYKILSHHTVTSNAGVGNTALHIARFLRSKGIRADARGTINDADLAQQIQQAEASGIPITHVVISAFWMPTEGLRRLCLRFPFVRFFVHSHSNDGFFQPDSLGAELLREAIDLQRLVANLQVSGNSDKFCTSTQDAYAAPCLYLPNLYFIDYRKPDRPLWNGGTLKIGIFGANRPQKNQANAGKAALLIAKQLNKNLEVYINSDPKSTNPILRTIRTWYRDVPGVTLREVGWLDWPNFRRMVSHMDLLMAPSYTESFCNVVADAIVERTPTVVSDAMDWVPKYWRAEVDDVNDIAHVGRSLLTDARAGYDGLKALDDHNTLAFPRWEQMLKGSL